MDRNDFQLHLEIAIDVLGKQNVAAIRPLKEFLCSIPSPKQIEQVLATAVLHFAADNQAVFAWIITNQNLLAPEIDLLAFTKGLITSRLRNRGWTQGQDFQLEQNSVLFMNQALVNTLTDCFSQSERILVSAVLIIHCRNIECPQEINCQM